MQPVDRSVSAAAKANLHEVQADGSVHSLNGSPYPHLLLRAHRSVFGSVALPLEKPAR
jgi:hypothetical protein